MDETARRVVAKKEPGGVLAVYEVTFTVEFDPEVYDVDDLTLEQIAELIQDQVLRRVRPDECSPMGLVGKLAYFAIDGVDYALGDDGCWAVRRK